MPERGSRHLDSKRWWPLSRENRPGLGHLAPDRPARLGRVVGHHGPRGAAPAGEDLGEAGAQALGALGPQGDALPVAGVGQRRDEGLGVGGLPGDDGPEAAEVGLAGPDRPLELEAALAGAGRAGEPPVTHEAPHRRVGPLAAALGDQPVVDPPGGVSLPARGAEVGPQDRGDPFLVARRCGPLPRGGDRRGGRQVLHARVLRHGVPADVRPISALGTPSAFVDRMSSMVSRGKVISSVLPGRARQSLHPGKP